MNKDWQRMCWRIGSLLLILLTVSSFTAFAVGPGPVPLPSGGGDGGGGGDNGVDLTSVALFVVSAIGIEVLRRRANRKQSGYLTVKP
jgi:hypothetical protein